MTLLAPPQADVDATARMPQGPISSARRWGLTTWWFARSLPTGKPTKRQRPQVPLKRGTDHPGLGSRNG